MNEDRVGLADAEQNTRLSEIQQLLRHTCYAINDAKTYERSADEARLLYFLGELCYTAREHLGHYVTDEEI